MICDTCDSETVSKGVANSESCRLKHHTSANLHCHSSLYYMLLSFPRPKIDAGTSM
jgi:hypothetical protein